MILRRRLTAISFSTRDVRWRPVLSTRAVGFTRSSNEDSFLPGDGVRWRQENATSIAARADGQLLANRRGQPPSRGSVRRSV